MTNMMKRHAFLSMIILIVAARTAYSGSPPQFDVAVPGGLAEQLRDGDASVRQAAVFALREMRRGQGRDPGPGPAAARPGSLCRR